MKISVSEQVELLDRLMRYIEKTDGYLDASNLEMNLWERMVIMKARLLAE